MSTSRENLVAPATVSSSTPSGSLLEALYGDEFSTGVKSTSQTGLQGNVGSSLKGEEEILYTLRYRPSLVDVEGSVLPSEKVWVASAPGVALAFAESLLEGSGIDAAVEWEGTNPDLGIMGSVVENTSGLGLSKGFFSVFPVLGDLTGEEERLDYRVPPVA